MSGVFRPEHGDAGGRARRHRSVALLALLVPAVAFMVATYSVPVGNVLLMSVGYPTPTSAHFAKFFGEPTYLAVIRTTFVMSALITAVCVVLAYPAAYLMAT